MSKNAPAAVKVRRRTVNLMNYSWNHGWNIDLQALAQSIM
jgi:hypothetical protein